MKEVKKRILWVDIAKAIAILSVPISHTIPLDTMLRSMIFSIHMPLFFILSGFTTHLAEDWKTLFNRLKKNLKWLILPTFAILIIFTVINSLETGTPFFNNLGFWLHEFFIEKYPYGFYNASAVWFLVALFWAKLLMDVVNVTFKSDKNLLFFFLFGVLGIFLGISENRPPLFIDLGLVGSMFMAIGLLWRRYEPLIKKYTPLLLVVSAIFWFSRTMRGDYVELWTRFYAGYEVSILVAVAGTFLVANFAMMLEESLKKAGKIQETLTNTLVVIGKNTMLLYMIHCLDTSLFTDFWDVREGDNNGLVVASVFLRLGLNLALFIIIYQAISFIKRKKAHTLSKKS